LPDRSFDPLSAKISKCSISAICSNPDPTVLSEDLKSGSLDCLAATSYKIFTRTECANADSMESSDRFLTCRDHLPFNSDNGLPAKRDKTNEGPLGSNPNPMILFGGFKTSRHHLEFDSLDGLEKVPYENFAGAGHSNANLTVLSEQFLISSFKSSLAKSYDSVINMLCSNPNLVIVPDCFEFEHCNGLLAKIPGTPISAERSDPNPVILSDDFMTG
jgi:hypothetical protein